MIYTIDMKIQLIESTTEEFGDDDYATELVAILNRTPVGTELEPTTDFGDQDETDMIDTDRIILAVDYFFGNQHPF